MQSNAESVVLTSVNLWRDTFCIPFLALVYSCCYAQLGIFMFAINKHHKDICKNRSFDPPLIQPDQRVYQSFRSKIKSKIKSKVLIICSTSKPKTLFFF